VASEGMAAAEQRLADYAQRVQQIQQRAEQSQEQIRSMRARAVSPDGVVSVVLAPGGRLEDLNLTPEATRLGHDRLAALIKQTVQAAHADAAAQTQAALQPLLGESDAMEFLKEQLDTGLDAEEPPAGKDDEDFDGPIMRRD
jgi:DNA-binding protein YbaB